MADIKKNLLTVREKMENAAVRVGRDPEGIRLIAVSKTVDVERIRGAIASGATTFGENYVQEARDKIEQIGHAGLEWHFIGHLQTNKAKYAVGLFDLIHSVDSVKLARELDKRAAAQDKMVDCLIEVKLSQENAKFGIGTEDTLELATAIDESPNLSLKGLMTMPPYFDNPESARPYFITLRRLKEEMERGGTPLPELSMGMSVDFETAIEEGATIVRVGRAIFGERT